MKITPETTLAELELERMRLGITSMLTTLRTHDGSMLVEVMCLSDVGMAKASASSMPEAIADALAQVEQLTAEHATRWQKGGPS